MTLNKILIAPSSRRKINGKEPTAIGKNPRLFMRDWLQRRPSLRRSLNEILSVCCSLQWSLGADLRGSRSEDLIISRLCE